MHMLNDPGFSLSEKPFSSPPRTPFFWNLSSWWCLVRITSKPALLIFLEVERRNFHQRHQIGKILSKALGLKIVVIYLWTPIFISSKVNLHHKQNKVALRLQRPEFQAKAGRVATLKIGEIRMSNAFRNACRCCHKLLYVKTFGKKFIS